MSKIIQITSAGNDGGMMLFALCEDGSLWEFSVQTGWIEMPLIAHGRKNEPREENTKVVLDHLKSELARLERLL